MFLLKKNFVAFRFDDLCSMFLSRWNRYIYGLDTINKLTNNNVM